MATLAPIQTLTPEGIRRVLLQALRGTRATVEIADFVAGVDWSRVDVDPPTDEVLQMMGALESLTTAVSEGDIDESQFTAAINGLASTYRCTLYSAQSSDGSKSLNITVPRLPSNTTTTYLAVR